MAKAPKTIIEYRDYDLPAHFPVILLTGDHWRISEVPSKRLHIHNCLEIGVCESDSGLMEFEDTAHPFHAGDITIISCDVPHTTYSTPGTASKWSYLFVDVAELLHPFFSGIDIYNNDSLTVTEQHLNFIITQNTYPVIRGIVMNIIREMKNMEEGYELSVRGLFLDLSIQLVRMCSKEQTQSKEQPKNALVIAPALEYIRYHYMENFPIEHLAGLCGLSPTHFRRLFSSIMGTSPLDYLNITRIRKAAKLLRMTEHSILSISERVGFHSISSFNRHFLAIMKHTPREWRQETSILKNQSTLKYHGWMYAEVLKKEHK